VLPTPVAGSNLATGSVFPSLAGRHATPTLEDLQDFSRTRSRWHFRCRQAEEGSGNDRVGGRMSGLCVPSRGTVVAVAAAFALIAATSASAAWAATDVATT